MLCTALRCKCSLPLLQSAPPPPIRTDSGDLTTFSDGKSKSGEQVPVPTCPAG